MVDSHLTNPDLPSNRELRMLAAAQSIPRYTRRILHGLVELNQDSVLILYHEYRAYFGSPRAFKSDIRNTNPSACDEFAHWSTSQILSVLRVPSVLDRQQALSAIYCLWAEVTVDDGDRTYVPA